MNEKTMDEIRVEIHNLATGSMEEASKAIFSAQEEILIAFIAKYGIQPDEAALCFQGSRFWVEKRNKDE